MCRSSIYNLSQKTKRNIFHGISARAIVLAAVMAAEMLCSQYAVAQTPSKPNILFILTDDQGWASLGCYGNRLVPTPNLDRLAASGIRFTDAYVMPQCTPTRAALMTGQHGARNGMWHVIGWYGYPWARVAEPMFKENLSRDTFTIAKGLKSAGYTTACIGKWHLTNNEDGHYVFLKPEGARYYGFDWAPADFPIDAHRTGDKGVDWLTDHAIEFITKNKERPWFCYLAHHTIHGPVVAPEDLVEKYRKLGYPETGMFNVQYLAAIEHLDRSVGRLLKSVDQLGLADNTVVVFLSDNGGVDYMYDAKGSFERPAAPPHRLEIGNEEFDNAPLRAGKGSMYEGGIRVPCIVRWPGVTSAARVCKTPIHVIDWMPTLFEIAGATIPADHSADGQSIVPILRGEKFPDRSLYWNMPLYDIRWGLTPSAVVRRGDYKLIEFVGDRFDADGNYILGRHVELYNLREDIGETRNLADAEPERVKTMLTDLHQWLKRMPQGMPGLNEHYDREKAMLETREKPEWAPEIR